MRCLSGGVPAAWPEQEDRRRRRPAPLAVGGPARRTAAGAGVLDSLPVDRWPRLTACRYA
jgi:hypothetical protein